MSGTKTLGCGLIGAGVLWLLGAVAFFGSGLRSGGIDVSAAILGVVVFGLPIGLILGIAGVIVYLKGRNEAAQMADAGFEQRVLDMIETRGSVRLRDLAEELGCETSEVEDALHDLVGKRLFRGFINWHDQRAYSDAAADMESGACPNCGGKVDLAGKDLAACPYCGTEFFLDRE